MRTIRLCRKVCRVLNALTPWLSIYYYHRRNYCCIPRPPGQVVRAPAGEVGVLLPFQVDLVAFSSFFINSVSQEKKKVGCYSSHGRMLVPSWFPACRWGCGDSVQPTAPLQQQSVHRQHPVIPESQLENSQGQRERGLAPCRIWYCTVRNGSNSSPSR